MITIRIEQMPDVAACGNLRFMLGSGDDGRATQGWSVGMYRVVGTAVPDIVKFIFNWLGNQEGDETEVYEEKDLRAKFREYLIGEGQGREEEEETRGRQLRRARDGGHVLPLCLR